MIGASAATLLVITFIVLPEVAFSLKKSRASAGPMVSMIARVNLNRLGFQSHRGWLLLGRPSCYLAAKLTIMLLDACDD